MCLISYEETQYISTGVGIKTPSQKFCFHPHFAKAPRTPTPPPRGRRHHRHDAATPLPPQGCQHCRLKDTNTTATATRMPTLPPPITIAASHRILIRVFSQFPLKRYRLQIPVTYDAGHGDYRCLEAPGCQGG